MICRLSHVRWYGSDWTMCGWSLWLGEWDHFTRRTETFQKISNMYSYFLYILHCMDFRWWRGGGRMATAAGPSCGPSARGVKPPSVLRPGCCCYMQEIAPVDYWHQAHISSLGGPRHFGTGPGLTVTYDLYWRYRKPVFSCWFSWKWFSFPFYQGDISDMIVQF